MAVPAAPVTEIGYMTGQDDGWLQWTPGELVPELQWPAAAAVYERIEREDGSASSVIDAIKLPLLGTPWRIEQGDASDEITEFVAQNLGLPIAGSEEKVPGRRKGRFSWTKHLDEALDVTVYGHAFFEQTYRIDENDRTWIRKLAARPQGTITKINVATDGGLESIEQDRPWNGGRWEPKPIPVNQLVAYVRKQKPGIWTGQSVLRPAYKHWLFKDELMRIQAATARRNGMGVPVGTAASNDQAEVDQMADIAQQFKGGMNAGIGLAPDQKMELLGVSGNLPDMQQAINFHDKKIGEAALANFLNLDRGGSYALAEVLVRTFNLAVNGLGGQIADIGNAHVIEDLVDLNWGEDAAAPKLVFDPIGSEDEFTAAALALLLNSGALDADETLKANVRQRLGLPSADPETT